MLLPRWFLQLSLRALGLILLLIPALLFAQTATLKGKVTDAQSKEELPSANVLITAPGKSPTGAVTDPSGNYMVPNLAAGSYSVSVSFVGYTKKDVTVTLAAGESKTLDFALEPGGINLNAVVISASRRQEKILDAPASIAVLEAAQIRARPTLSPAEHLRSVNGVDMASTGLTQSNVVTRGFNNIFSGALLTLTDNRISAVPSLRLNANNFLTFTNEDIERVEVVLGPGSALYGPNSANGVLHFITRSPFDSKGTSVSLGGGERSVYMSSLRHAGVLSDKVGYKFSAQYYQGHDWEYRDPAEEKALNDFLADQAKKGILVSRDTVKIAKRNFDIEKIAGEGRIDVRATQNMTLIFNGGYNQADNIEPTGIGAGQAVNWRYYYLQSRLLYKNLFVQGFMNSSNAGDTYLLRSGAQIKDDSKLYVGQVQHSLNLGQRQRFIYGVDILRTRPDTKGSINGGHEDDDSINEFGVYMQSDTKLSSKFDFLVALRFDDHNFLDDPVFSPRAALVFKPNTNNTLRATYNRAFSTPSSNNLFLDLRAVSVPTLAADTTGTLGKVIGETLFDVYAEGTARRGSAFPRTSDGGFHFNYGADGRPQMVSYFGPILVKKQLLTDPNAYLVPDVNSIWPALRELIAAGEPGLAQFLPETLSGTVPGVFKSLNTETSSFDPVPGVKNIEQIKPTITSTFELGYKGVIAEKLAVSVDVYYSKINNFVGPLITETPHVFVDTTKFAQVLADAFRANPRFPSLLDPYLTAQEIARGIAGLPIGLVSPIEDQSPTKVILTYRNFGNVSLGGLDASFSYYAGQKWVINGNYSFVTKDYFDAGPDQPHPIALNAPKHKMGLGLQYRNIKKGLDAELRGRYSNGFPMNSGVYIGDVQTYMVFDANFGYNLAFLNDARLAVIVQNILNEKHREFVGVPEIGRLVVGRLTYTF
jgi:iron complex outermembrane receptor protein